MTWGVIVLWAVVTLALYGVFSIWVGVIDWIEILWRRRHPR